MTILVAFASTHGSTRGVAERLASSLAAHGLTAEARAVIDVEDVGGYDGFILGSAVHNQRWLPEAAAFVRAHRAALASHPLWLFSVSSVGDEESFFPPAVARWLRRMRGEFSEIQRYRVALNARGHRNFAGAVETTHWSAIGNLFLRALGGSFGDHRNWTAIEAWAAQIGVELRGDRTRP